MTCTRYSKTLLVVMRKLTYIDNQNQGILTTGQCFPYHIDQLGRVIWVGVSDLILFSYPLYFGESESKVEKEGLSHGDGMGQLCEYFNPVTSSFHVIFAFFLVLNCRIRWIHWIHIHSFRRWNCNDQNRTTTFRSSVQSTSTWLATEPTSHLFQRRIHWMVSNQNTALQEQALMSNTTSLRRFRKLFSMLEPAREIICVLRSSL